jgi:hypothetical protein
LRVFSHANEKSQKKKTAKIADSRAFGDRQRKPVLSARTDSAFHRTRRSIAPLFAPRPVKSFRARRANEKSAGPVANPHTARSRRSRACPRIALGSRRARDRPRRPRERTPSRRAPPRLPRRVAPRASLVAVGRNRHLLPYRSRERSRGARRDEHRVRVRDGGGQGPPHGEVLEGLRGLEGASHDALEARTTRAFVPRADSVVSACGGRFFTRAATEVSRFFFFFFFRRLARGPTERR